MESDDNRKLGHWMIMLWIGGLGFGGHLVLLLIGLPGGMNPIFVLPLFAMAVVWSIWSAVSLFRHASRGVAVQDDPLAENDRPEIV